MTANQSAAPNNDNAVAKPAAAAATAVPAPTASSTTPNISPIKTSSKKSSPSPSSSSASKIATATTAKIASKKDSAVDNIKFTSTSTNKKSSPSKSSHTTTTNELKQLKLHRAEIAKRELKEMEAMERAFREDMMVWSGPSNVVFPRRYHTLMQLKNDSSSSNGGGGEGGGKKKGSEGGSGDYNNKKKEKEYYYGSQSQGWMYGDGLARLGQLSWMDVTSPPSSSGGGGSGSGSSPSKRKKVDTSSSSGFLMDDVTIIDKALQSSGLTRSNLTPRAYACLLEQARRYTLELLADAQDYALHAARDSISTLLPCDLLLAAEMRDDVHGISSTLPCVEDIQGMADEVNRVPLPAIPRDCYGGVVLPPVEDQLTARTFDVVNGARVVQRMLRGGDYPMSLGDVGRGGGGGGTSSTKRKVGSYGAGIGRQIAVNLKSSKKGEVGISGSTDKDVGATASASPSQPAKATKASSSGSKGQKRKLTAL